MKISRRIWRLGPVGSIATANLVCFGIFGVLHIVLFPDGIAHVDRGSPWESSVQKALLSGMLSLSFPVTWLGSMCCFPLMGGAPPLEALIFVPINAYVWGWIGAWVWEDRTYSKKWLPGAREPRLQRCWNPPDCTAQFALDLTCCPACGTPVPEGLSQSNLVQPEPSFPFIVIAGIVAPLVLGALPAALVLQSPGIVVVAGVAVGAWFIRAVVRMINRRADSAAPRER